MTNEQTHIEAVVNHLTEVLRLNHEHRVLTKSSAGNVSASLVRLHRDLGRLMTGRPVKVHYGSGKPHPKAKAKAQAQAQAQTKAS